MPCPVCNRPANTDNHRTCLVELFKTNKIQSVKDWEELCKPKTIVKRRIKARVDRE